MEVWRSIKGYEGVYMVSDYGRIRSMRRVIKTRGGGFKSVPGRIITPTFYKNGKYALFLHLDGEAKYYYVKNLVWESFGKSIRKHHKVVNLDGDSSNCRLDNLGLKLVESSIKSEKKEAFNSIIRIVNRVSALTGVAITSILSKARKPDMVRARMLAVTYANVKDNAPVKYIAELFGVTQPAIRHLISVCIAEMDVNKKLSETYKLIN